MFGTGAIHGQLLGWAEWQQGPSVFLVILGCSEAWTWEEPSDMLSNSTKGSPLLESPEASQLRGKQEAKGHSQTWGPGHQKKADNLIIPPGLRYAPCGRYPMSSRDKPCRCASVSEERMCGPEDPLCTHGCCSDMLPASRTAWEALPAVS